MRARLIYNSTAGGAAKATVVELLRALVDEGYDPDSQPTASVEDLDDALRGPVDLVTVAGVLCSHTPQNPGAHGSVEIWVVPSALEVWIPGA